MPTELEYMQFATDVYATSNNNTLGAPSGWTRTRWQPDTFSGFSAGTFVGEGGREVVISYTGTNDKVLDPLNWTAGMGLPAPQIFEAMRYYFSVKAAHPKATISFTGHSLGGGLAALMAVYFDKRATVFDAAPFQEAALSRLVLAHAGGVALAAGGDADFLPYMMTYGVLALSRESNVTNYATEGEVLSYFRRIPALTLGGADRSYKMGASTASAVERHSMALLTAMGAVDAFHAAVKRVPFLVTEMMDENLFAAGNMDRNKDDILRKLLRHQLGVSGRLAPDQMLERFTADVDMATRPGGLTMANENLAKALVAFAMQMYDRPDTAADKTLFRAVSGGIRFDRKDVGASLGEIKGYVKYFTAFLDTLGSAERSRIDRELPVLHDWFIQSGSSAMNAAADERGAFMLGGETDDQLAGSTQIDVLVGGKGDDRLDGMDGDDVLLGGEGDDTLSGGAGIDILLGGDGDDQFESGTGNDTSEGGKGHDTYRYFNGDGKDIISDSDGDGEIRFEGTRLDGGKRNKGETIYTSRDKAHRYHWDGNTLTINDTIFVSAFNNGDLGIYLDEEGIPDLPDWDPEPCDPLVLDLDGNGKIDTIARTDSTGYFDFNNDGIAERSGWIAPQDGLLVLDANGNGAIDNLSELFGTAKTSGFADLKQRIDSNGDNSIDAGDEKFGHLRVWQDANGDGIAQGTEVFTLGALGITSIGLDATDVNIEDAGNRIAAVGTYVRNGETRLSGNVQLSVEFRLTDSNPVRALDQVLTLDADLYRLPWLRGFGQIRTLTHAYQLDPLLRQAAADLAGRSAPEILAGFGAFFVKWSGLEAAHRRAGVTRNALTVEDKVWMLETLMGRNETKSVIEAAAFSKDPHISWNEAQTDSKYIELVGRAALGFAMQAAGKALLDGAYYSLETDKFVAPDPSRLQARLQERLTAIVDEGDARFAALVLARLKADEVNLDAGAIKQALSESPFAQLFNLALEFSGQHVAVMPGNVWFQAADASGWFLVGSDQGDSINGGEGDDVLIGAGGSDWLYGAAGRDTLAGGAGNDSLHGHAGNDLYLIERGGGVDTIDENGGTDTIRFGAGIAASDVRVTRNGANLHLSVGDTSDRLVVQNWFSGDLEKVEWIEFADGTVWAVPDLVAAAVSPTQGADLLNGGSGNDALAGLGGNDRIAGEAGDDLLDGGAGNDDLQGGTGNDVYLFARGDGADSIYDVDATAGNIDTIRFAAGIAAADVSVTRDQYNLHLSLAGSGDRLTLKSWFYGASYQVEQVEFADGTAWGVQELLAAASVASEGAGHHEGGSGNDTLIGLGGDDTLEGAAGDDTLNGGTGNDRLRGGSGNDIYLFERGDGADTISESGGNADTIRFGAGITAEHVRVTRDAANLYLGLGGTADRLTLSEFFSSTVYQLEQVEFADGTVWGLPELWAAALVPSDGADYLVGASSDDALAGQAGNDTLRGDAGDDTLHGGAGNDHLDGGRGHDVYLFERGDGADFIHDNGPGDDDTIRFGAGITPGDVLVTRNTRDLHLSLAGSGDRLTLGFWDNDAYKIERIEFADGTVWGVADLTAAAMLPTEGMDHLAGTDGDDTLTGLGGDDWLYGGGGNDVLSGADGDDAIYGGDGADTLAGGRGADDLVGGSGNDVYLFERGDGADTVHDTEGSDDVVRFGAGIAAADLRVTRDADNVYLTVAGTGDRLTLGAWFWDERNRVERIAFADGSAWSMQDLLGAVGMATEQADYRVGTEGNDSLLGLGGGDTLDGGAGNDTLDGGTGNDVLRGGVGNDLYLFGRGDGADIIAEAGTGDTDVIRFRSGIAAGDVEITRDGSTLYLRLSGGEDRLTLQRWFSSDHYKVERVEFADGTTWSAQDMMAAVSAPTSGNDYLEGTSADDVLAGGDGNDTLLDSQGSNVIDGGDGNDVVNSAAWSDGGAPSADFIGLGKGDDALGLVGEHDVIAFNAGDGHDTLARPGSALTLSLGGGISADRLALNVDGHDLVLDMGGGDSIRLSGLATSAVAKPKIILQIVGATIQAYDFSAVVAAFEAGIAQGAHTTSLPIASALAAHVLASSDDQVIGGNLAYRYARDGNLSALTAEAMRAAVSGPQFGISAQQVTPDIGSIAGTAADDALVGSDGRDRLWGMAGHDTLDGGLGNDTYLFDGSDGQDRIVDAGGIDTIVFGPGIVPESLFLSLEAGALLLNLGRAGDAIRLEGFDPHNVSASPVIEQFRFSNGLVLSYEQLLARGFEVTGDGLLSGTAVHDLIVGGGGDDTLAGGKGNDVLNGDLGNDRYLFNLGDGVDTLYDIASQAERNRIVFGTGITRANLRLERQTGAITLHYSAADAIVFPQIDLANLVPGMAEASIELADGSVLMLAELLGQEVVALADDGGAVTAGGSLALSAQSLLANDSTSGATKVILGVSGRSAAGAAVTYVDGNVVYDTGNVFRSLGQGVTHTDTFTYTVGQADASVIGTATVTVTVTGENDTPTVAHTMDAAAVLQGRLFSFTIPGAAFADADAGEALSYGVTAADGSALPGWLSFDAATATLRGRPGPADIGVVDIKVVATDRAGAAASSTFALTVVDMNDAPVFANPIAPRSAVEGDLFTYTLAPTAFVDDDAGDTLSYSAALASGEPLPAWLGFDPATMTFSGTPDLEAIGSLRLRITAADPRGYEGTGVFELTVQGAAGQTLAGTGASDSLVGMSGDDTLDGAAGIDFMAGKRGNDTYIVDNLYDRVIEQVDEGIDMVRSSASFTLSENVENLVLTGPGAINGTGNALNNVLTGNSANNILDGRAGADTMAGGLGNDTYVIDDRGDVATEEADAGTDLVQSATTHTLGAHIENLTLTGTMAINGTGNDLNNVMTGNGAANILAGGAGNDTYVVDHAGDVVLENAAAGIDLVQSSVGFTLGANVDNLTLTGSLAINGSGNELDNVLTGNSAVNILYGGAGNDTLNGGVGADQLIGGAGDDVYVIDNAGDLVTEQFAEGNDSVQSSVAFTLGAALENLMLTGSGVIAGTGNALANVLLGNSRANTLSGEAGNDTLDGAGGADKLVGGDGDDTYVVDDTGDTVVEHAGQGLDLVLSSVSYTLSSNVEQLTLTGVAAINATGNTLDNILAGNGGANTLNGGAGGDTLAGGAGNDTYVVDHVGDTVLENAAEGIDLVQSSVGFALGANVENLTLTGSLALNGSGNELDNALTGNSGVNILDGGAGNDTLNGGAGADRLAGGAGDDRYVVDNAGDVVDERADEGSDLVQSSVTFSLGAHVEHLTLTGSAAINGTGNAFGNALIGNSGANILNGGSGADTLIGGAGNDTYVVDDDGDVVREDAGMGTDLVQSSVSYTLGANLENLTLTGTAAINGTGNDLNNVLAGNGAANSLAGGAGNDTYVVDHAADAVLENGAEGIDLVQSSVAFTLGANLENLTLTGSLAINGSGNELDNALMGNSAVNILYGGAGNDTLNGGAGADRLAGGVGDDLYVVDNAGDVVDERADEGTDLVQSSATFTLGAHVEHLTLTGSAAINGTGNAFANVLIGNSGGNILNGAAGADTLIGGAGNDTYVVDHAGDVVREDAGMGTDLVQSSINYTLGANLENLTLTGTAAVNGTGNELNNVLAGNGAANILAGGAGNDTYVVDHAGDVVLENAAEGIDLVQSSVAFTLGAHLESLTLTGSLAINGSGNELDNALTGNSAVNILYGGAGNDTLNGGAGADQLAGGAGDDGYVVDNAGDVVTERTDEGTDLVQSSVTHSLTANVEYLTLTGSAAINGTGNAGNNLIRGNGANNNLNGGEGSDIVQGGAGADVLTDISGNNLLDGGAGNDTLVAGSGNDFLIGGAGNDTITTGTGTDVIVFNRGDGQDVVVASAGADNTLSLGRGITYADVLFSKSGTDLVLTTGASEQITFKDWYASVDNRSIANLQFVIEGTAAYVPTSGNKLNDNKIEQFDFNGLVSAFDQARALNPGLVNWTLSASLLDFHLAGSDTAAIGGDLGYLYAKSGNLANVSLTQAQAMLASTSFGNASQTLNGAAIPADVSPRL